MYRSKTINFFFSHIFYSLNLSNSFSFSKTLEGWRKWVLDEKKKNHKVTSKVSTDSRKQVSFFSYDSKYISTQKSLNLRQLAKTFYHSMFYHGTSCVPKESTLISLPTPWRHFRKIKYWRFLYILLSKLLYMPLPTVSLELMSRWPWYTNQKISPYSYMNKAKWTISNYHFLATSCYTCL